MAANAAMNSHISISKPRKVPESDQPTFWSHENNNRLKEKSYSPQDGHHKMVHPNQVESNATLNSSKKLKLKTNINESKLSSKLRLKPNPAPQSKVILSN